MFDGYLSLGDVEIINAARTTKYVQTLVPSLPFVRTTDDYDTLFEALGGGVEYEGAGTFNGGAGTKTFTLAGSPGDIVLGTQVSGHGDNLHPDSTFTGSVTAYDSGTGEMTVVATSGTASGVDSTWVIQFDEYVSPATDRAVWVSPDDENTENFYGLYPLSIEGLSNSTRVAAVTQSITDGGFINAQRSTTRSIRIHGVLLAKDEISLESGLTWLRNVLRDRGYENPVSQYTYSNLRYFLSQPPADDSANALYPYERHIHRVKTTVSVDIIKYYSLDCDAAAAEVDFILTAENPYAYASPVDVPFSAFGGFEYFSDGIVNLFPHPSFEAQDSTDLGQIFFESLVTNPNPGGGSADLTNGYGQIAGTGGTQLTQTGGVISTGGFDFAGERTAISAAWFAGNSAVGGGVYYDVPVVAGRVYSFLVEGAAACVFSTSVAVPKTLQFSVQWRTASTSISTTSATAVDTALATFSNQRLINQTAPATATIARLRVLGATPGGGGSAGTFATGERLIAGGFLAVEAQVVPPAFNVDKAASATGTPFFYGDMQPVEGTDVASADLRHSFITEWAGDADLSHSRLIVYRALGATGVFGTGSGIVYRNGGDGSTGPGLTTARYGLFSSTSYFLTPPSNDAEIVVGGGDWASNDSTDWAEVAEGLDYSFRLSTRHSGFGLTQRMRMDVYFIIAGLPVKTTGNQTLVVNPFTAWTDFEDVITAPAGATHAIPVIVSTGSGTGYNRWVAGAHIRVDGLMVAFGSTVQQYLDGSMVPDVNYTYSWGGTANDSVSVGVANLSPPIDILADPDLPVLPTPPALPIIPNEAIGTEYTWLRYYQDIPVDDVPKWAGAAPILTLLTDVADVRQVRVRFYPNLNNLTVDQLNPSAYDIEFILSYLPADASLTIDGVDQYAYANVTGGEPVIADQVLYGTNGAPVTWGELSNAVPYIMTVDVTPTADIDNVEVQLQLARRE